MVSFGALVICRGALCGVARCNIYRGGPPPQAKLAIVAEELDRREKKAWSSVKTPKKRAIDAAESARQAKKAKAERRQLAAFTEEFWCAAARAGRDFSGQYAFFPAEWQSYFQQLLDGDSAATLDKLAPKLTETAFL